MCYEYSDWAWKARIAELAKKEREVESQRPAPSSVIATT